MDAALTSYPRLGNLHMQPRRQGSKSRTGQTPQPLVCDAQLCPARLPQVLDAQQGLENGQNVRGDVPPHLFGKIGKLALDGHSVGILDVPHLFREVREVRRFGRIDLACPCLSAVRLWHGCIFPYYRLYTWISPYGPQEVTLSISVLNSAAVPGRVPHAGGKMLSVSQVRRARGVLGWSQQELAKRSGVALPTIRKLEQGRSDPKRTTLAKLEAALMDAGVEFVGEDGIRYERRSP
jgi:DNA-binding XRE family transcriptional regulator